MDYPELFFQIDTSSYSLSMLKGRRVPLDLYFLPMAKKILKKIRAYYHYHLNIYPLIQWVATKSLNI